MKYFDRAALLLAACGTALVWLVPYLLSDADVPSWLVTRWYLLVCVPALVGGAFAFPQYAGFAKDRVVLLAVTLAIAGLIWTDPTEVGRGALLAVAILVPLPLAALIRKRDLLNEFMWAFSITTTASLIFAFARAGVGFARLADDTGTSTANPNSVGIQAALAALFLVMATAGQKGLKSKFGLVIVALLVIFCVLTASRTAFLAIAGTAAVSLLLGRRITIRLLFKAIGLLTCFAVASAIFAGPFYQGLFGRLIEDADETRDTFGGRVQIWELAGEQFSGNRWLYGVGTGGVDKVLGEDSNFAGEAQGPDGIWRLSPHNTLVWWALAFGINGLIIYGWLGWKMTRAAYVLDRRLGQWHRVALIVFVGLAGFGGVITQEGYWCVLGSALLAGLSPQGWTGKIARRAVPAPTPLSRYPVNA
jgi:O-antigen ligase